MARHARPEVLRTIHPAAVTIVVAELDPARCPAHALALRPAVADALMLAYANVRVADPWADFDFAIEVTCPGGGDDHRVEVRGVFTFDLR